MPEASAPTFQTNAAQAAASVLEANMQALRTRQPDAAAAVGNVRLDGLTWLYGRDGCLTAQSADGKWWGGSSLPLQVGRALMKSLEMVGSVGCFLAPATAGQIRAALEIIENNQALIVVMPDPVSAAVAMHCEPMAEEFASGRLSLVAGSDWATQLTALLQSSPGLCVPQQYLRTGLLPEEELSAMANACNPIFSAEIGRRTERAADIRGRWKSGASKICVVAGQRFSLWDLAGTALAKALAAPGEEIILIDSQQPLSGSPLAIAIAAETCGGLVAADLFRSDLPGVLPDDLPWITWATKPRFAAPAAASPHDQVMLADESWRSAALAAGWTDRNISIATWPMLFELAPPRPGAAVAVIADVAMIEKPRRIADFSSQATLWDSVAQELLNDPLVLGKDIDAYFSSRLAQLSIPDSSVDRDLFRRKLILPNWYRGIARMLLKNDVPLAVFGDGWDQAGEEFSACWGGPIESMEQLNRAVQSAGAIIHPSPAAGTHPASALGRPVITVSGRAQAVLRQSTQALSGRLPVTVSKSPILSAASVKTLLAAGRAI
jgi:hypothetical protein